MLLGTIKGDLHDIGKNIVRALLEGNGFEVVDIGIDNAPEKFVDAVRKHAPDVVGYSGLLTTTLGGMPEQIEALKKAGLREKVITIVGGAPVTGGFRAAQRGRPLRQGRQRGRARHREGAGSAQGLNGDPPWEPRGRPGSAQAREAVSSKCFERRAG